MCAFKTPVTSKPKADEFRKLESPLLPGADTIGKNSVGKEFPNLSKRLPKLNEYKPEQLFQSTQSVADLRLAMAQVRIDFARPEDKKLLENESPGALVHLVGTYVNPDGTDRPPLYFKLAVCYQPNSNKDDATMREQYTKVTNKYPEIQWAYQP